MKDKQKKPKTKKGAMTDEVFRETFLRAIYESTLQEHHQFQRNAAIVASVEAARKLGYIPTKVVNSDEFRQKFVEEVYKVYPRFLNFIIRNCPDFNRDVDKKGGK